MPFKTRGRKLANLVSITGLRWALNLDGLSTVGVITNKAIDTSGNIDIEFYTPSDISATGNNKVILSQNVNVSGTVSEFVLFISATTGNLGLVLNGFTIALGNAGEFSANEKLRINIIGTLRYLYRADGTLIRSGSITRNAPTEPTAQTVLGAMTNNAIGVFRHYSSGVQRDIKINGTLWPLGERDQLIQLPSHTGLGTELITQAVLENPASKGSQWSYLGSGRWQYVGDGSINVLQLTLNANHPAQGFLEFEVESISGNMTCTTGAVPTSLFSTTGKFRYYYLDSSITNSLVQFKRAGSSVASCIIKNISFKPLGSCNPIRLSGSTNWVEVPV